MLSHPCEFFRQKLPKEQNSCFVIMPFAKEFNAVYETIQDGLRGLMKCKRADDLHIGRPILTRILEGICGAELIIADLTGCNANVFYELGLVHAHTPDVLLLTQDLNAVPFDLRQFRCHEYSVKSPKGRRRLSEIVQATAHEVCKHRIPLALNDKIQRTEELVRYLAQVLQAKDTHSSLLIRLQAGLSSLSNVGYPDAQDPELRRYGELLLEERRLLLELLQRGASLRAVLAPPRAPWVYESRVKQRYDVLIEHLKSDAEFLTRCEIALCVEEGPNLFFIGDDILFEGHKTAIEGGYGWTTVITEPALLVIRRKVFDSLFASARQFNLDRLPPRPSRDRSPAALRRCVVAALERLKKGDRLVFQSPASAVTTR
jgi:hypothetical protein